MNEKKNFPKASYFYEIYMLFIGIACQCPAYIQAFKIFMCKNAAGISLCANILSFFCIFNFLIYGLLIRNSVLIVSNVVGLLGSGLVIFSIFFLS